MSHSWRDEILQQFVPNISKITIVADPDNLLTEEQLVLELQHQGFKLIEFNDSITFRYVYESNFRSSWDRGEMTNLVVVLRTADPDLSVLPYDLLYAGRQLFFNLGDLFPSMSYPVIEQLDRMYFDALYRAQNIANPDRMGDNATKDFILRYIFGIAPELITTDVDLFRSILRLHYTFHDVPSMFLDRFVSVLKQNAAFSLWPLEEIILQEQTFYEFLQERWPIYLSSLQQSEVDMFDPEPEYGLRFSGPAVLPFGHHDIRVYIDNLFVEGKLHPVHADHVTVDVESWIRSGITTTGSADDGIRIERLFDLIQKELDDKQEKRHISWLDFSYKWATLSQIVHTSQNEELHDKYVSYSNEIDDQFSTWLTIHYASLVNLPPTRPVMLHHIPRYLARSIEKKHDRVALIVIDGLALDQWITVREELIMQDKFLQFNDTSVFAWIPTITSVSRQSIFSGKLPLYYPSYISNTNNESKLWERFWFEYGYSRFEIGYQRNLGTDNSLKAEKEMINNDRIKILGFVVNTVDNIMHGMQLGSKGMHNQIAQWCKQGYLSSLIDTLLDRNFSIWITADHGNIECTGAGKPSEGVIAEIRGERVRIYSSTILRDDISKKFSHAAKWLPVGLPDDYYPLLAEKRTAFVKDGLTLVGHGGKSIEEVIVPFVKVERRSNN